ncbi:methyltransferase domain-containing protein [Stenotrophomonas sp.]|uniref:class I SAM-dependent methyltransferase n=1 Tax=Stenotrophomonas sp. TaxID=69392 RepID=UPI003342C8B3
MTSTLLDIPFDHYQRYAAAAHLLQALELEAPSVLEVGANRQRLLGQFLPQATFLYTDLHAEGDEKDFVVADATQLPFGDRGFDAVVSLDVLEHIPAPLRARAVAEMARVANQMVVIGCPPDEPWVREAELDANGRWRELYGEDYVWLQEHKEFGLVDSSEVESILDAAGLQVLRFGQGDARLWASLMGSHFIKVKFPELEPLVTAADRLYNSRVFAGDHSDQPYRHYYVGVRNVDDAARLQAQPPFRSARDEEATTMLSHLAEGLRRLALRADNAEQEWSSTARLLQAYITDLDVAKQEWGATAAFAHQLQAAKDVSDAQWLQEQQASQALREVIEQDRVAAEARELTIKELRSESQVRSHELQEAQQQIIALRERVEQELSVQQTLSQDVQQLQRLQDEKAMAYLRSRRRWQSAVAVCAVGGSVLGLLAGWAWL